MNALGSQSSKAYGAGVGAAPKPEGPRRQAPSEAAAAERDRIARLLAGDEAEFARVVSELHPLLLRLASTVVRSTAVAEEVVQDTWVAVVAGLPTFAARSKLKTWIVQILFNRARTRAVREARSIPFSALGPASADDDRAEQFSADGSFLNSPKRWQELVSPESLLADAETRSLVEQAISELPEQQRLVIELRDIGEMESAEVCQVLNLSEANQRVLLHRARGKVRSAISSKLG